MSSIAVQRLSAMSSSSCVNSISISPKLLSAPLSFSSLRYCNFRAYKYNHEGFNGGKQQQHYSCFNAPPLKSSMAVQSTSVDSVQTSEEEMIIDLQAAEEAAEKIKRLQNGPDVRGIAMEGEKGQEVNLTPAAVYCIAEAFGEWVGSKLGKGKAQLRISLGRDPRITGPSLMAAAAAGLMNAGCCVYDMGLATTPACFMSTSLRGFAYDASIMLTASHLPYRRNGLKFLTRNGGIDAKDVESICTAAASKFVSNKQRNFMYVDGSSCIEKVDFMAVYAEHLRNIIKAQINHPTNYNKPLQGFKIIVNAGNGSGGFFAWDVLEQLGADVSGSLNLQPDGMFPNHIPNPEDKVAMAVSSAAVLKHKAHLGIVFDTDVDRSGVVDQNGKLINGDRLIGLMAAIILNEYPGTTIVTDARTSEGLTKFITDRGGHHCLYRVGYRNVINKGIELNENGVETHLMMETSGHGALRENYFLDDGAYMAMKIIIEMVRRTLGGSTTDIGSLIQDLEEPKERIEMRINILSKPRDAKQRGAETIEAFRKFIVDGHLTGWQLDSCGENCRVSDGCLADFDDILGPGWSQNETHGPPPNIDAHMYRAKVVDEKSGGSGWVHMRQSVHNPNIAIIMQSSVVGGCHAMGEILLQRFFKKWGNAHELDITEVERFATERDK